MAPFHAKQVGKCREREKIKIVFPFRSYPTGNKKFPKKKKKNQKNQIIPLGLHFESKQVGKGREMEKIKIVVPFRSHPTCKRKFQRNSENFEKIKKHHYSIISSQNRLDKADKERK